MSSNQQVVNQSPIVAEQMKYDYQIDYNNAAKTVIATALGEVPVVGFALSALVEIFWPQSQEDIWAEIKDNVEQLVDQKISDLVYQQVQESLTGLHNNLQDYLWALQNSQDNNYISQKYNITLALFNQELPHFQSKGYELLLLPLFTQFANLHLSLLRDGVLYGSEWGWTEEIIQHTKDTISATIQQYIPYTEETYTSGLNATTANAPTNSHNTEPFCTINRYVREMTLTVLDFKSMWIYNDPTLYPEPVQVILDREIYSDPFGTADNSGLISLPLPPTKPITQLEVWAWDRIDACQVTYEAGGGPGGVTQTARMGDRNGGASNVFDLTKLGPVVGVTVYSGSILNSWYFTFSDGSTSSQIGGKYPGGNEYNVSYPGEMLSSIKIMGVSYYYGSADCAVFGFKFNPNATPDPSLLRLMYESSPKELTPHELARYAKAEDVDGYAARIQQWSQMYHWDVGRRKRWEVIRDFIKSQQSN